MPKIYDSLDLLRQRASQAWAKPIVQEIQSAAARLKILTDEDLADWQTYDKVPKWMLAGDERFTDRSKIGKNMDIFTVSTCFDLRAFQIRSGLYALCTALAIAPEPPAAPASGKEAALPGSALSADGDLSSEWLLHNALRYWHTPLKYQRWQLPGWYQLWEHSVLAPDGDGEWFGTAGYLEVLPIAADFLDAWLTDDDRYWLHRRTAEHCSRVEDDYYTGRSWFFGGYNGEDTPLGNQFTSLMSGFCLGALSLKGVDPRADRWLELGVSQLLRSLDATGSDGSFFEGTSYASGTFERIYLAAYILGRAGEKQLIEHPLLLNYPYWVMDTTLNDYDTLLPHNDGGPWGLKGENTSLLELTRRIITLTVSLNKDPQLNWYLHEVLGGPSRDLYGILFYDPDVPMRAPEAKKRQIRMAPSGLPVQNMREAVPEAATLPYGTETSAAGEDRRLVHYPSQGILILRSGFQPQDQVLVLKGGWTAPSHDHIDRNSFLFYDGVSPVIIEAGRGPYSDTKYEENFRTFKAHSTLQLDGKMPGYHDPDGKLHMRGYEWAETLPDGTITLVGEAAPSYPELSRFRRTLQPAAGAGSGIERLLVTDEVIPGDGKVHQAAFWFHTPAAAHLQGGLVHIPTSSGEWHLAFQEGDSPGNAGDGLRWMQVQPGGKGSELRTAFCACGQLLPPGAVYQFVLWKLS